MSAKDHPSSYYVWIDTEFSSLELEQAHILQLAAMVTTPDLRRVVPAEQDLVLSVALAPNQKISPWVEENIPAVVAACRGPDAIPLAELDVRLCNFIDAIVGGTAEEISSRPVLAGNSLHADWFLLRRFTPRFLERLHYRMIDVSSLKLQWLDHFSGAPFEKDQVENLCAYFPDLNVPDGAAPHDAYYDIQASAAELAYYRSQLVRQT